MTVTKKLLLINSLICIAFVVLIMVVFFSSRYVEKMLTTTFTSETRRIIENSHINRELNRILSDMNLIVSTFYENDKVLETDGLQLFNETQTLLSKSVNDDMKASLNCFMQQVIDMLIQCKEVNLVRKKIREIEKDFDRNLVSLDNFVSESLVELMVKGENTANMEQLSTMIGGWRESFAGIKFQFVDLGLEHFKLPLKKGDILINATDELMLRLRAFTAAPDIARHDEILIRLLKNYKSSVLEFYETVGILRGLLEKNESEKESLILMMEMTDKEVAKKTEEATKAMSTFIARSLSINLCIFLGILPIVVLAGITAYSIKRPVKKVIEYIERLSKGDIPEQIDENYKGEFNLIKDYLNILIKTTNRVTQIAEDIALGNMEIIIKERSHKDRLMQALERMIQKLKKIMNETKSMIRAVADGKLYIRGNTEIFEGVWHDLVSGINDLIVGLGTAVSKSAALSQEMELARRIQTSLLPNSINNLYPDFEIAASMLTADKVGGDYHDIILDKKENLWLSIGDVSGHGVTSGLIMMMAQTIHTTIAASLECDARSAVAIINQILYENVHERLKEKHFMTFNTMKYLGNGKFQHAGAHLRIIVYRQKSGKCELIKTKGVYLNFKKNIFKSTKNSYFEMYEGDVMVLYTDGLTEAQDSNGELLDIDRFIKIIESYAHHKPEVMKNNIMADVIKWCNNKINDDMTLLIIKRKGLIYG